MYFQYDGDLLVGEYEKNPSGVLVYELEFLYDSTGSVLSMVYNGTEYYYVKNLQGDIIGILDGQGNTVVTYTYDSWGKLLEIRQSGRSIHCATEDTTTIARRDSIMYPAGIMILRLGGL